MLTERQTEAMRENALIAASLCEKGSSSEVLADHVRALLEDHDSHAAMISDSFRLPRNPRCVNQATSQTESAGLEIA